MLHAVLCVLVTRLYQDYPAREIWLEALNERTEVRVCRGVCVTCTCLKWLCLLQDVTALKNFAERGGAVVLTSLLADWPTDVSLGAEVLLATMATASGEAPASPRPVDLALDKLSLYRRGQSCEASAMEAATWASDLCKKKRLGGHGATKASRAASQVQGYEDSEPEQPSSKQTPSRDSPVGRFDSSEFCYCQNPRLQLKRWRMRR